MIVSGEFLGSRSPGGQEVIGPHHGDLHRDPELVVYIEAHLLVRVQGRVFTGRNPRVESGVDVAGASAVGATWTQPASVMLNTTSMEKTYPLIIRVPPTDKNGTIPVNAFFHNAPTLAGHGQHRLYPLDRIVAIGLDRAASKRNWPTVGTFVPNQPLPCPV